MSLITSDAFKGSSGSVCPVCGRTDCHEAMRESLPFEVTELTDYSVPERMYRVREEVHAVDGSLLYHVGADIPLDEAVQRGLPGAKEMALGSKPQHSAHDRSQHPEFDR